MQNYKGDIIQEFFKNVGAMRRAAIEDFQNKLGDASITPGQAMMLLVVSKHPDINSRELADILTVTPGAIAQNADALEKAGYIHRFQSKEDRRVQHLTLTKLGAEKTKSYAHYHSKLRAELAEYIGDDDLAAMARIQQKLTEFFKEKSIGSKQEKV